MNTLRCVVGVAPFSFAGCRTVLLHVVRCCAAAATRTHGSSKRPGRQRGLRASLWPFLKWSRPNRQGGQERRGGENGRRSKEPARRLIWDGPRVGQNNHAQTTLSLGKQQTDGNAQTDTTSQSTLEDPQQSWPHDPKWHRGCCCCGCCC